MGRNGRSVAFVFGLFDFGRQMNKHKQTTGELTSTMVASVACVASMVASVTCVASVVASVDWHEHQPCRCTERSYRRSASLCTVQHGYRPALGPACCSKSHNIQSHIFSGRTLADFPLFHAPKLVSSFILSNKLKKSLSPLFTHSRIFDSTDSPSS